MQQFNGEKIQSPKISKTEGQKHQVEPKLWKLEVVFNAMLMTFLKLSSFMNFPQQLTILMVQSLLKSKDFKMLGLKANSAITKQRDKNN